MAETHVIEIETEHQMEIQIIEHEMCTKVYVVIWDIYGNGKENLNYHIIRDPLCYSGIIRDYCEVPRLQSLLTRGKFRDLWDI